MPNFGTVFKNFSKNFFKCAIMHPYGLGGRVARVDKQQFLDMIRDEDYEYGYEHLYKNGKRRPAGAEANTAGPDIEKFDWQDNGDDEPDESTAEAITRTLAIEQIMLEVNPLLPEPPEPEDEAARERGKLQGELGDEALTRIEEAARTEEDFKEVRKIWNRLDRNRERRERRHEMQRGDVPLEYGVKDIADATIFPRWKYDRTERQLASGNFLEYLFDCPYEMHDLTSKAYLRKIVMELKEEHKEILFFLYLRRYSPKRLAALRGQTERNIRKVRDTVLRKVRKKTYHILKKLQERGYCATKQEREFLQKYEATEGDK